MVESIKEYNRYREKRINPKKMKDSNTVAIMGNGPSINEIDQKDISFLEKCDVIAMNKWAHNDEIIPDIYIYEGNHNPRRDDKDIELINNRSSEYSDTLFIIKSFPWFYRRGSLSGVISRLEVSRIFMVPRWKYHLEDAGSIDPEVYTDLTFCEPLPQIRGTLDMCLCIAYIMDYKRIVLYGVDLSEGYFWTHESVPSSATHGTERVTNNNPVKMSNVVQEMNKKLFQPQGVGIFIRSTQSNLYPQFDILDI